MTSARTKYYEPLRKVYTPQGRATEASSDTDKDIGHIKQPRALAIVLMVYAYSPTAIAD